ncbi:MAG: GTP 3',8-cyclase MoaA [Hungatella sp.]
MIDSCHRTIDYIRISLTDRCNLRCVYCMPEEGVAALSHDQILTYEEILRLCRCFAKLGIHKVKLTGGEPLVRKDVPYLIKQLKQIEGIDNITLTTNGILLKAQMEALAGAGIDGVNISLDTLDPQQFFRITRYECLDRVLEGLEEALRYPQVNVKINCVPMEGEARKDTVIRMAGMARDRNLPVRFIELMPIGLGKELHGYTEEALKMILSEAYGPLQHFEKPLGNGPCVYYTIDGFQGQIGFISAISHKFCDQCNRIRLTADGSLKNCLQFAGGVNLKKVMEQGITDADLVELIRETILKKPQGHEFGKKESDDREERNMSQIGG